MNCPANYYDLQSSEAYPVTLTVEQGHLLILGLNINMRWPVEEMRVSERLGRSPRTISHKTKGFCEVADLAALDELLKDLNHQPNLLELVQHNRYGVLACTVFFVILIGFGYFYGLPVASKFIAIRLPKASLQVLDGGTLESLKEYGILTPSKLSKERQQALTAKFAKLVSEEDKSSYKIVYHASKVMGPNAFALPSGTIVMLDDLVSLSDDDNELMGVLGHELGHVQGRHAVRMVLQTSAVGLAATWWLGDVSSLLAAAPAAILGAKYSRDMEREADSYGIALMRKNGLSSCYLATILGKLEASFAEKQQQGKLTKATKASAKKLPEKVNEDKTFSQLSDYLASHPETPERMRALCPAN